MNILLVLIPLSMAIMALAVYAFFWAVENEQLEDYDAAGLLPLLDQPEPVKVAEPAP